MNRNAKLKSLLLGGFFLSQLAYLLIGNLIQFFPREIPDETGELLFQVQERGRTSRYDAIQKPIEIVGTVCDRWSDVSGLWQGWTMFAPYFPHQSVFPVIGFENSDGSTVREWEANYRPTHPDRFFRLTDSRHRLFNFETRVTSSYAVLPCPYPFENEESNKEWKRMTADNVRRLNRSLESYLAWRTQDYLKRHPKQNMPKEVWLGIEIEPTPSPGQPRMELTDEQRYLPFAQWRPGRTDLGYLPVEPWAFDWQHDTFDPLKAAEKP